MNLIEFNEKKLRKLNISLSPDEVRKICKAIGRKPSIVKLYIFNAEWSEHCSYKSSKKALKILPTSALNVVLGPGEDARIVRLFEKYCLVVSHESHNHSSPEKREIYINILPKRMVQFFQNKTNSHFPLP